MPAGAGGTAADRVPGNPGERGFQTGIRGAAPRLRGAAFPALPGTGTLGEARVPDLPETGGPEPHGSPQNQQRGGTSAAGPATGKETDHRGDGSRAARGGHGHGLRTGTDGMRDLHGTDRHGAPAGERGANEDAGGGGTPRDEGKDDAKGGRGRGPARLDDTGRGNVLPDRFGRGATSLPGHGGPAAISNQRGNPATVAGPGGEGISRLPDHLHRGRQQRGRHDLPLPG